MKSDVRALLELATEMALDSLPGVFTECANQPIIQMFLAGLDPREGEGLKFMNLLLHHVFTSLFD